MELVIDDFGCGGSVLGFRVNDRFTVGFRARLGPSHSCESRKRFGRSQLF